MTLSATLARPAYFTHPTYTRTLGPEVVELSESVGFVPDEEQRLGLDVLFALNGTRAAAFEFAVVCSRQNLKTGLFKMAALGWLFITEERLIVWSAHEFDTAVEAFRDMSALIEASDDLTRLVKRIYTGNGSESIELMSGQRLKFKARTRTGGRGLTGDKIVLDEAFALHPTHMGALMPTLSVVPDPQLVYGSSAGLADSDVLRELRDRGRVGGGRLAYFEWTAPKRECANSDCSHVFVDVQGKDCALDDRELWYAANPTLGAPAPGRRMTEEYVASERQALPWAEFARERLGWWDDPGALKPAFGTGKWEACAVDLEAEPEPVRVEAFGVAVSIDRAWSSIGAAAHRGDGRCHLGAVDRQRGTHWLLHQDPDDTWHGRMVDLAAEHDCAFILDGKGPASDLIKPAQEAGLRITVASTEDVIEACSGLFDAVQVKGVTHGRYDELDAAVAGAMPRSIGDRWVWGRKPSLSDISMLEAVNLAYWGADSSYNLLDSIG